MVSSLVFPLLLSFVSFSPFASAVTVCGLVGIHNETLMTNYMGNFFYRGPDIFGLCASYCKSDPTRCKAFWYSYWADADAQYCEFYDFGL
jgi:hypothetical protein